MKILSERGYQKWSSWQPVYEWEDILSEVLNIKISNLPAGLIGKVHRKIRKNILSKMKTFQEFRFNSSKEYNLFWIMNAAWFRQFTFSNCLPIFIDFDVRSLEDVYQATRNLPVFWVTCYQIYEMLLEKGATNVSYMPLSVSDVNIDFDSFKSIDVIQVGRKNKVLHEYMLEYIKENPEVEYVYQVVEDGVISYYSTNQGNLGDFNSRAAYLELLSKCKISLVSSPGIDSDRIIGTDFITPRFFESAARGCMLVGRYTENKETDLLHIADVCANIKDYSEFKDEVTRLLEGREMRRLKKLKRFVQDNSTSTRAIQIAADLKKAGLQ